MVRSVCKKSGVALLAILLASSAFGQDKPDPREESKGAEPKQAGEDTKPLISPDGIPSPSIATSLPQELGGAFGFRKALADHGFQFGLNYIGEGLGNTSGGFKQRGRYEGRLEMVLDGDLEKAFGMPGLTFHANAFQIHGRGLSRYNVGNLAAISNIEATRNTRLFELWLEQKLPIWNSSVRFGQLAADQEFIVSTNAGLFINGTFGWPTITAANLPSGGPAYPLATPGIRVKIEPVPNFALLAAIFNGDPAGPFGPGKDPDPQVRNPAGVNFRVKDPPFIMGEGQLKYDIGGLPGVAKLGGWVHVGRFADQRFGTDFLSLNDPNTNGVAIQRRGNRGIYGVLDQQIYRLPGAEPDKGIGVFLRASASPNDRNLVSFYLDGGVNFAGFIPGRPNDAFGVAASYIKISGTASALDYDFNYFNAPSFRPVRAAEAVIEATYQAQIVDGFTIQPNFQYVVRPGGGILDPNDPTNTRAIRNAAIFGLRTTIRY